MLHLTPRLFVSEVVGLLPSDQRPSTRLSAALHLPLPVLSNENLSASAGFNTKGNVVKETVHAVRDREKQSDGGSSDSSSARDESVSSSSASVGPNQPQPSQVGILSLVGIEKDGSFLFCSRTAKSTQILLYDFIARRLVPIFGREGRVNVVSASISANHYLLAYTEITRLQHRPGKRQSGRDHGELHQSWLVEVQPQGRVFSLEPNTSQFQGIKFLHQDRQIPRFLFFVHGQYIQQYTIKMEPRTKSKGLLKTRAPGMQINSQPHDRLALVDEHLWFQFMPERDELYVLVAGNPLLSPTTSKGGPRAVERERILHCIALNGGRGKPRTWEISVDMDLSGIERVSLSPFSYYAQYYAAIRKAEQIGKGDREQPHLVLIELRSQVVMVRYSFVFPGQTGPSSVSPLEVRVAMYALGSGLKLEKTIPLTTYPYIGMRQTGGQRDPTVIPSLVFAAIHEMLLLWIPGFHLELFDVGGGHPATTALILPGALATSLPSQISRSVGRGDQPGMVSEGGDAEQANPVPVEVVGLNVFLPTSVFHSSSSRGKAREFSVDALGVPVRRSFALLDCRGGVVYEVSLSKSLKHLFLNSENARAPTKTISLALHMLLVHIGDTGGAEEVLSYLASSNSSCISAAVLAEFLVGMAYSKLREEACGSRGASGASSTVPGTPASGQPAAAPSLTQRVIARVFQGIPSSFLPVLAPPSSGMGTLIRAPGNLMVTRLPLSTFKRSGGAKHLVPSLSLQFALTPFPLETFQLPPPDQRDSGVSSPDTPDSEKVSSPGGVRGLFWSHRSSFSSRMEANLSPRSSPRPETRHVVDGPMVGSYPVDVAVEAVKFSLLSVPSACSFGVVGPSAERELSRWISTYFDCERVAAKRAFELISSVLFSGSEEPSSPSPPLESILLGGAGSSVSARSVRSLRNEFGMLQQLYAAAESLSFPLPKEFNAHLAGISLLCLSPNVFLQCVNRGVIVLDDEIIEKLLDKLIFPVLQAERPASDSPQFIRRKTEGAMFVRTDSPIHMHLSGVRKQRSRMNSSPCQVREGHSYLGKSWLRGFSNCSRVTRWDAVDFASMLISRLNDREKAMVWTSRLPGFPIQRVLLQDLSRSFRVPSSPKGLQEFEIMSQKSVSRARFIPLELFAAWLGESSGSERVADRGLVWAKLFDDSAARTYSGGETVF